MKTIRRWWYRVFRKERLKHADAMLGKTTSGHLDSSERAAAFQRHRKLPK